MNSLNLYSQCSIMCTWSEYTAVKHGSPVQAASGLVKVLLPREMAKKWAE